MATLIDQVTSQLDDNALSQLSRQLGIDESTTRQAVPAALTALLGGLSQNAAKPEGAQQLAGALSRDHDGSILDDLAGYFGNSQQTGLGGGILGHVFGNRQPDVANKVGRASGLDAGTAGKLLMMLAPLVLGALSRRQQGQAGQGQTGGFDPGILSDILGGERRQIEQKQPQSGGLLNSILDRDGDGNIMDDLAGMAGDFLGGGRK